MFSDRYGWKGRIGYVSPALWDTTAYEYAKILPEGTLMVVKTLNVQALTDEQFIEAISMYEDAALRLAKEECDFIIMGGSPIATYQSSEENKKLLASIYKKTGVPIVSSLGAAMEAFAALSVKKLVVATPYRDERNKQRKAELEKNGYEVLGIEGMQLLHNVDLAKQPRYSAYKLAKKVFFENPGAQGIYISCARWPTVSVIEELEQDCGVPVFTSVQVTAWAALKALNIRCHQGYGKLMEMM